MFFRSLYQIDMYQIIIFRMWYFLFFHVGGLVASVIEKYMDLDNVSQLKK